MEKVEDSTNPVQFNDLIRKFGTPVKPTKKPPRPEKSFKIVNDRVVWIKHSSSENSSIDNKSENCTSSNPSLKGRSDTESDAECEYVSKLDNITNECVNFINNILKSLSYLMGSRVAACLLLITNRVYSTPKLIFDNIISLTGFFYIYKEFKAALHAEFHDNKEISSYLTSVFREIEPLHMLYKLVLEKITELKDKGTFCLPDLFLDNEIKGPLNIYKSFFGQYSINSKWLGEFIKSNTACQEVCKQVKERLQIGELLTLESCLYSVFGSLFSFDLFINRYASCFGEKDEARQKAEDVKTQISSLLSIINKNLDQENFLLTHKELNLMTGRSRETKIATKFIYKGNASKLSRRDQRMLPRQLMLFSDCLYVTLLPGNITGTCSVRQELSLDTMQISKIISEDDKISLKWGLNIFTREALQDFYFEDEETMNLWISKLQLVIGEKAVVPNDVSKAISILKIGEEPPRWQKDCNSNFCNGHNCNQRFSSTVRRHHCRTDGLLYCDSCCSLKAVLKFEKNCESRVCEPCYVILNRDKISLQEVKEAEKQLETVYEKKTRKGMKMDWLEERIYNCEKGVFNSSVKYFCELHNEHPFLALYDKLEDKNKHHGIMLLRMTVCIKKQSRFIRKLKPQQFTIEHMDKNEAYLFDTPSPESCNEWVQCLNENIQNYCSS